MYRHVFGAVSAVSITFLSLTPAAARGLSETFAAQNSVRAGFYLRLPFTGGLKASAARDIDYGFAMTMNRSMTHQPLFAPRRDLRADIVKLNFTNQGFETFSLAGQNVLDQNGWQLDASKNGGGFLNQTTYLIVGGLAVVGLGVLTLSRNDDDGVVVDSCEALMGPNCPD